MECLKLVSSTLDLPQLLQGVDCILKHVHLLLRTEMGRLVNKQFMVSNLLLLVKNEAMSSSIPMTISNPHRRDVGQES